MTIKVKIIVGGVCLDRTFESSALAKAYLAELHLFDFELVPVAPTPDTSNDLVLHAFLVIDKNPGLTLEDFASHLLEICRGEEFTVASIKSIFEEAKILHAKFYPDRENLPLPYLAFALFKENGYNSTEAYHILQKQHGLSKREALAAIKEAGLA